MVDFANNVASVKGEISLSRFVGAQGDNLALSG